MSENKLIKKKWPWIAVLATILVLAVALTAVFVIKPWEPYNPNPEPEPEENIFSGLTMGASSEDLYCLEFTSFSGAFYEDGSNEEVENIAAILVENRSDEFLEKATITYDVDGKTATFVVTALPSGKKCWVLEQNRMEMTGGLEFKFLDCVSGFRKDTSLNDEVFDIVYEDDVVTVTNKSDAPLYSVCVYYKNIHDDGNYLGGITYLISLEEIKAGETAQKRAGHFGESSEIVRTSYLTEM